MAAVYISRRLLLATPSGRLRIVQIFVGDGGKENEARRARAVVFFVSRAFDEVAQIFLESGQTGFARERFVVTEKCENHIGFRLGEPLIGSAEVRGAQARFELVGREAEIAQDQIVSRKPANQVGIEPAVVLHAIGQRVADDADVVVGFDFECLAGSAAGAGAWCP